MPLMNFDIPGDQENAVHRLYKVLAKIRNAVFLGSMAHPFVVEEFSSRR